jgi:hypothetical protein
MPTEGRSLGLAVLAFGFNFRRHRSVLRSDRHIGLNPQRLPTEARNLPADRSSRISVPAVISQRHLHQPDLEPVRFHFSCPGIPIGGSAASFPSWASDAESESALLY